MDNKIAHPPSSIVPIAIQETYDTGKVKDVFLYCDCGCSSTGIILGIYNGWALWLKCSGRVCNRTWYICNRCIDCRKKIKDKPALDRHHRNQHLKGKTVVSKEQKSVTADNNTGLPGCCNGNS